MLKQRSLHFFLSLPNGAQVQFPGYASARFLGEAMFAFPTISSSIPWAIWTSTTYFSPLHLPRGFGELVSSFTSSYEFSSNLPTRRSPRVRIAVVPNSRSSANGSSPIVYSANAIQLVPRSGSSALN